MRKLPGMPTHWLWGNAHQIGSDEASLMKLCEYVLETKYKVFRVWIGPFYPTVWITHGDIARKLLKEPKDMAIYSILKSFVGDSLIVSEGGKWKRNRHLLNQAFHFDILKDYVSVFNNCLEILLKKWKTSASDGKAVLAYKDVGKLTLDIIMRCAMNSESDCQLSDSPHQYIKTFSDIKTLIFDRAVNFLHGNDLIYYYFTRQGRKFKQACQVMHDYVEAVI